MARPELGVAHQGNVDAGAVEAGERRCLGRILAEGLRPLRLEVERVDEDEHGIRRNRSGGHELWDPLRRALRHPAVDPLAGCFGVGREVEPLERCAVGCGERPDELGNELVAGRRVHPVGEPERRFPRVGERLVERVERGVRLGARRRQVEDALDLRGCLAPGTGVGHPEGDADRERREDDVLVRGASGEEPVEVEAEAIEPFGEQPRVDGLRRSPRHVRAEHHRLFRGGGPAAGREERGREGKGEGEAQSPSHLV